MAYSTKLENFDYTEDEAKEKWDAFVMKADQYPRDFLGRGGELRIYTPNVDVRLSAMGREESNEVHQIAQSRRMGDLDSFQSAMRSTGCSSTASASWKQFGALRGNSIVDAAGHTSFGGRELASMTTIGALHDQVQASAPPSANCAGMPQASTPPVSR